MSGAYYNENDPFAAAWLRELIKADLIAPGEVDERSIEDVQPEDVKRFTQCHWFAGIGVWSYALRNAGWADDIECWTGSCPCQSFSAAGKGEGFSDKRHLWPAWFRLIRECKPDTIFGEQVASKDGLAWLDVVSADMEGTDYAIGTADLCAAGFGAPHIRQRLFFVADSANIGHRRKRDGATRRREPVCASNAGNAAERGFGITGSASGQSGRSAQSNSIEPLAHPNSAIASNGELQRSGRLGWAAEDAPVSKLADSERNGGRSDEPERKAEGRVIGRDGGTVAHTEREQLRTSGSECAGDTLSGMQGADGQRERIRNDVGEHGPLDNSERARARREPGREGRAQREASSSGQDEGSGLLQTVNASDYHRGPTNGFWRDAEWLYCRDGKYRPTKPGTPVLATGITNRVGQLRGFGNSINAEVAKEFIKAYMSL